MQQHGLLRSLAAAELSDGTLRYLLLIAALLSPRPAELMILNEPEASLHPDLLPPLARLIGHAAGRSQVIVVTHAAGLIAELDRQADSRQICLEKSLGETVAPDAIPPPWAWPSR
jgi:predicted ATPase